MKKIATIVLVFLMTPVIHCFSQDAQQGAATSMKKDQNQLFNDVNISYGIGTIYLFTSEVNHSYHDYSSYSSDRTDISSPGTFMIGYNRMLNKIVMIGFVASYINCSYKRSYVDNFGNTAEATFNDNLLTGMARITFNYVNKPVVRVYSSAGMGITVDLSKAQGTQAEETDRKLLFAGQLTFMGVRFGRSFGGFCEFGFGTNGIIVAGLNYQFGD